MCRCGVCVGVVCAFCVQDTNLGSLYLSQDAHPRDNSLLASMDFLDDEAMVAMLSRKTEPDVL